MKSVAIKLAISSIRYRRSSIFLSVISIALSVALLLGIERIRSSVKDSFSSTISGTDLIVGARTGNLSLLLATVFQKGNVNKNISWESYKNISERPEVNWTIPISLGDSHKGYPVVATTSELFVHYKYGPNVTLSLKRGQSNISDLNCVLGSYVAKELGYDINENLLLTHGMGEENFVSHKDDPFTVTGILSQTGTPVDKSIFVSLNALDHIHDDFYNQEEASFDPFSHSHDETHEHEHEHEHEHHDEHMHHEGESQPSSITGFYLGLKNKSDILKFQRTVNEYDGEPLLGILPAITLLELWSIIKPIENVMVLIALIVLLVSIGSVVSSIISTLNQRRREMSVLRSIGARPSLIFKLIVIESASILIIGEIVGIVLLILSLSIAKPILVEKFAFDITIFSLSTNDILILLAILLVGIIIGLLPAIKTYKQTLTDGLTIKT